VELDLLESVLGASLLDESLWDVLDDSDDDFSALAALLYESLR
jgi:hypothetical protein